MLPQKERLRRGRDFAAVYARKKSWANPLLVLYLRRFDGSGENAETRRFGFSVSKKVGKAHDRNRVKRRLREICRTQTNTWRRGFDVVFVVRAAANTVPFAVLSESVADLAKRAGLIPRPTSEMRKGNETQKGAVAANIPLEAATNVGVNGSSSTESGNDRVE